MRCCSARREALRTHLPGLRGGSQEGLERQGYCRHHAGEQDSAERRTAGILPDFINRDKKRGVRKDSKTKHKTLFVSVRTTNSTEAKAISVLEIAFGVLSVLQFAVSSK